ncbi:MAG TPA: Hsp70 family protein, partial [Pilimelia sp.]|nr:Hsp70 family protein [Pilimelia sp.]
MPYIAGVHAAGFRLGIDFGTSHTVAVLRWPDGRLKPLLCDGSPLLPSAVYAEPSGVLAVGRDAVHSARLDPARFEPNPKRRIDDGWVLLGDREVEVVELVAAVLRRVADEARRTAGGIPTAVTVSCPAAWGASRRRVLGAAAARAGLGEVGLVEEPVAAATYFVRVLDHRMPVGSVVVVYDLGGGTFDVSVVERTADGFRPLATDGRDDIGGLDLDDALVRSIGALCGSEDPGAWQRLVAPATAEERRQRRLLWDDVRGVKERLSRHATGELHVPGMTRSLHVTREEFETLARPLLAQTVALTANLLRRADTPRERVAGVFLVGGSSRIPLVHTMVHRGLEIAPTVIDQPELVVAEGTVLTQATVRGGPTLVASGPLPPPE